MSDIMTGRVLDVESARRGAIVTSWVATTATVLDDGQLPADGGTLSPDDGVTLYAYTATADNTLTMADTAPTDWPAASTDDDGDTVPAEVRLDLWPEQLEVWAQVAVDDSEVVPCVVPHALRPLLAEGMRDTDQETVQAQIVGGVWTIADVLGERAAITGTDYFSPAPDVTPRAEMVGPNFRIVRLDDDGDEVVTASFGGDDGDFIQLSQGDADPAVSFASDGSGVLDSLSVNSALSVGGSDLGDILAPFAKGVQASYDFPAAGPNIGSSECGVVDIAFDAEVGRTYRVVFDGYVYTPANTRFQLFLRARSGGDGLSCPAPTLTASALWQSGIYNNPVAGLIRVHLERSLVVNPSYTNTSQYRVLLSMRNLTSNSAIYITADVRNQYMVEDCGNYSGGWGDAVLNAGGGTPLNGSGTTPPDSSVKTYTQTWNASAVRSWRGSGEDDSVLAQGYYGGYQRYSVGIFPSSVASTLSGATIQAVYLYLKNLSWWYSAGGYARIGHYNSASLPSSPQTSGGGAFTSAKWSPGAAMWVAVPSGWWPDLASGAIHGFTLGEGAGTSANYYGKFSSALADVRLQVKYTK